MNQLYLAIKDTDLVILRVSIKDSQEVLNSYRQKLKLDFPIFMDISGEIASGYGVRSHPTGFFIDRAGKIAGRLFGGRDWMSPKANKFITYLLNTDFTK